MAAFGINQGGGQQTAQRPGRVSSSRSGRIPQPTDPDFQEKLAQERQAIQLLRQQGYDDNSLIQFQRVNGSVKGLLSEKMFAPQKAETPQEKYSRMEAERKLGEIEAGTRDLPKPEQVTDPITGQIFERSVVPPRKPPTPQESLELRRLQAEQKEYRRYRDALGEGGLESKEYWTRAQRIEELSGATPSGTPRPGAFNDKPALIGGPGLGSGVPLFKPMTRGGVTPVGKQWEQDYDKYNAPILNYDPEGRPIGTAGYREKPPKPKTVHPFTDSEGRLMNRVLSVDADGTPIESLQPIMDEKGKQRYDTKSVVETPINNGVIIRKAKRTETGEIDEKTAKYEVSPDAQNKVAAIHAETGRVASAIGRLESELRQAKKDAAPGAVIGELNSRIETAKKRAAYLENRRKDIEEQAGEWKGLLRNQVVPSEVLEVAPPPATQAASPTQGEEFRVVITPDGRRKRVPASRLDEVLKMGGTVVE